MDYCCADNKRYVSGCAEHKSKYDCSDCIITYSAKFDEYTIMIHDGGTSGIEIRYCPWCGKKFSPSKRDLWFSVLAHLGFEEPLEEDIPVEFNGESWYTSGNYSEIIDLIQNELE